MNGVKVVEIKNIPPILRKGKLKERLAELCDENNIVFLSIFGSFARGKQKKKSDIDMLVKFENGKSLLDIVRVQFKLQRLFKRKIDLVTMGALSPYIKDYVLNGMKVIYEKR